MNMFRVRECGIKVEVFDLDVSLTILLCIRKTFDVFFVTLDTHKRVYDIRPYIILRVSPRCDDLNTNRFFTFLARSANLRVDNVSPLQTELPLTGRRAIG